VTKRQSVGPCRSPASVRQCGRVRCENQPKWLGRRDAL